LSTYSCACGRYTATECDATGAACPDCGEKVNATVKERLTAANRNGVLNDIEKIEAGIKELMPDANTAVIRTAGGWWLDATLEGHWVVVECRLPFGFGLSAQAEHTFAWHRGEGPDEIYRTSEATLERALQVLGLKVSTTRTE
jgi:DNA-directed RNA polymerase subunit RPC12/RpoP